MVLSQKMVENMQQLAAAEKDRLVMTSTLPVERYDVVVAELEPTTGTSGTTPKDRLTVPLLHGIGRPPTIARESLQTLYEEEWLDDEVIGMFLDVVLDSDQDHHDQRSFAFTAYFYHMLVARRPGTALNYDAVQDWTKDVPGEKEGDIFSLRKLLIPMNIKGNHWVLTVVDFKTKTVQFYDSYHINGDRHVENVFAYLRLESQTKRGRPLDCSEWTLLGDTPSAVPRQMDACNCGVFVCVTAFCVVFDRPFSFDERSMPFCRLRVADAILRGRIED